MSTRLGAALLAAATLILGFISANATGNRFLGGIVLVIGGATCAFLWWKLAGFWRALACVIIAGIAFAISHPLGALITSWGSVVTVSAVTAALAYALTAPRDR